MSPVEKILAKLPDAKANGKGWLARCPAHDDQRASLSIGIGDDDRVLIHCHAGCPTPAVLHGLGLTMSEMYPDQGEKSGKRAKTIVAEYTYRDEDGNVLFQVVRYDPKDFRQRRPKASGGWDWSVKGVRVVPYCLPELRAEPTRPVTVVEGEKDVDNLARIGVLATCNAGGAGKWTAEHAKHLTGRTVIVLADNDDPGRNHAEEVAVTLHGVAESVRIIDLPGLPLKGDVSDWIAAGGTKDVLTRLIEATPVWTPTVAKQLWPEIISFDELNLPDFPTEALPPVLRHWIAAESHATQTPPDLAGLLALAVCSATIARRVEVEPRPGWREPINLFVAVLLEPGNRKSGVFADATRPLRECEEEMIETARPTVARLQSERRQAQLRLQKLEKAAAEKGDAEARHEASELAAELADQLEPVLPRLIIDDATSEKLGMMLAEQGGRIASLSPEGGVFDLMAGMYSKSGIPQFGVYLMGHSGDDLNTDRVSRKSVRVQRPALTCAYAMQPQVIEGLAENAAFRGRGLLARFLYATPQSWIGHREIAPSPVPDAVGEAYRQAVRRLTDLKEVVVLCLTPEATAVLHDWEAEIEGMLADGGLMEIMRDWGAKLAGATLRLAAVLHCVHHGPEGLVGGETIAAAVEIARYLIPHAEAVLNLMQAKEASGDDDARYVLRWIERHERHEFTKRDAQQHGKRRFPKADDIDPALGELVRRGYIRLRPTEAAGPGRPPSPNYEVNPAILSIENAEKRSQSSHNSTSELTGGHSGNIGSALQQPEATNRVQVTI
jgi:putative DNA primase/helicase